MANLIGGAGNDSLVGTSGADTFDGGPGNDSMWGQDGNDTLTGGTGNDSLDGGWGDDTFIFNSGDGQDTVYGYAGLDTLQLGTGILPSQVTVSQSSNGDSVIVQIVDSTDQITLQNSVRNSSERFEQIKFADGTIWSWDEILTKSTTPTAADDKFFGDERSNSLSGGAGNDSLWGQDGNDTLTGGTGNDSLDGGWGDDTFIFNSGDGQDTVYGYAGLDTLQLGTGILPSQVTVSQSSNGDSVIVQIVDSTDQITLQNSVRNSSERFEQIKFADGTIWSWDEILTKSTTPTAADDKFFGDERSNSLSGGAGNDSIWGKDGNDTLTGGTGNDSLDGGWGDDTFVFNSGDGQDTVYGY